MLYRYYLKYRPVGIGTQPQGFVDFRNYDRRTFLPNVGCEVWGWVKYERELGDEEIRNYELVKGEG